MPQAQPAGNEKALAIRPSMPDDISHLLKSQPVNRRGRVSVRRASGRDTAARVFAEALVSGEREVDWVSGACLLTKRDAAVEAGLLDERYFMYEEDVDFCAAIRARGGRILFTPVSTVTHLRGRSVRAAGARPSHYDRSHLAFYEKHHPAWAPWLRFWLRLRGRAIR